LAKKAIENYIRKKKRIDPPQKEGFKKRAGTFVSIKKDGQLR
jgi:AMMECR1 domain-containing protein